MEPLVMQFRTSTAVIDTSGRYRYSLLRSWDSERPRVCFIMLNPSTADADQDDPTIRRCVGFARTWGYGSIEVVNLFAYRATKPAELKRCDDPIGTANDWHIDLALRGAGLVVAAWGAHGDLGGRDADVCEGRTGWKCLGLTRDGHPRHPLYVRAHAELVPFTKLSRCWMTARKAGE